jgi:hypothetical protein
MLNAEMMTTTAIPSGPVELVPAGIVAAECHVTRRTISRWILDAAIGPPGAHRDQQTLVL